MAKGCEFETIQARNKGSLKKTFNDIIKRNWKKNHT